MNAILGNTGTVLRVLILCGVVSACGCLDARTAEQPSSNRPRADAQKLEQRAAELKALGQGEEAERLMTEARALRAQGPGRPPGDGEPVDPLQRQRQMQQRLADLKAKLEERTAAGAEDQAAEIRQQIERAERALRESNPAGSEERPRRDLGRRPGPGPTLLPPPERLEHLRIAVEHLHAAGLHEAAERLAQEGNRWRERMGRAGSRSGAPDELQRVHEEMRELREMVQDLRRRVEAAPRPER